jgi:MarR family transcriptional regulator, organic hydroperoxide resistance regulator
MKLELSLSNLVTKAARVVTRDYQKECAPLGISPSQGGIVYILARLGEATQVEIARVLHLDKANVNAMVKRLEAAGYLRILKDEKDGRKGLVSLTETGHALSLKLNDVDARVGAAYLELAGDPKQEETIRKFLERIVFGEP